MHILRFFLLSIFLLFSLSISGCQGNNSDVVEGTIPVIPDTNTTQAVSVILVLPETGTTLTINSQVVTINIRVFDDANNPYDIGTIKRINPSDVLTGRDIGSFDKNEAEIVNGVATFVYTGPADLSADTSSIVFAFYHSSNSANTKTYTVSIAPEEDQIILTNYNLQTSSLPGVSMNLESSEAVSYTVYDLNGVALEDEKMKSIVATSLNPNIATLSDSFGNSGTSLTLLKKNNMTVNVNSNTKSGIVPIKVEANFIDINGDEQNLTETFSILVLSGPPSAISLSYSGTENIKERAKFLEKWIVTVTDKYSNKVNTKPSVSMGLIAGFAQSSAATTNPNGYLFYEPDTLDSGSMDPISDTFTSSASPFSNVDDKNDVLVVYGTGYKYDASGKWDITKASGTTLNLIDDYASEYRTGMGFAVGNNQREDTCRIGTKWVANVYSDANESVIDETGTMAINVEYDYYLTGKSTMLWVNLVGIQNSTNEEIRLGQARKINLRGLGLDDITLVTTSEGTYGFSVRITDTPVFLRNSNFSIGSAEVTGAEATVTYSVSNDITSCANDGISYVTITVSNKQDGQVSVSLKSLLPSSEF